MRITSLAVTFMVIGSVVAPSQLRAQDAQLASTYTIDCPAFQGAIHLTKKADGTFDVAALGPTASWRGTATLTADGKGLTVTRVVTTTTPSSVGTAGEVGNKLLGEKNWQPITAKQPPHPRTGAGLCHKIVLFFPEHFRPPHLYLVTNATKFPGAPLI